MTRSITVTTGARLHLGPLSYQPQAGRHFGGVGVMIDEPGCRLTLREADRDTVTGDGTTTERVHQFVSRYRAACPADRQPPPCDVAIDQKLPSHNGLGSGTQIGLAVARGLASLAGDEDAGVSELARRVGRGRRSAVGIHGFAAGGLIVDAGQSGSDEIGSLACRLAMPTDWRVLLITPRDGETGLSGEGEERAFETLGSMPTALTDRLCRLVVTELLPAVQKASLPEFSEAVYEYGRLVGEFFAPVQGGTFGHPLTDALIAQLRRQGITGTGQTSWGPTVFAFVPDEETGHQVADTLKQTADVRITELLNTGATVEVHC